MKLIPPPPQTTYAKSAGARGSDGPPRGADLNQYCPKRARRCVGGGGDGRHRRVDDGAGPRQGAPSPLAGVTRIEREGEREGQSERETDATAVLTMEPGHVKAHHRRSQV
jgi:hypothetical protein